MKISVVTVCLNAEVVIERTLRSVVEQTSRHLEYVVIDGGSTDGTLEIIGRYAASINVFKSEKDRGVYDAMNKGLCRMGGDAVIFMNAGDIFISPYVVEVAAEQFRQYPTTDVLYGGIEVRFEDDRTTDFMPPPPEEALEFLILHSLPHQGTFARRGVFAKTGLFDTRYRSHADYDWFLKVATDPSLTMRRAPFLVASFGLGGLSSQLEKGERERHTIQNKVPNLQSERWLKRRVELYQDLYIAQRVRLEEFERTGRTATSAKP